MPRYYGIMLDGKKTAVGAFGEAVPKHLVIPERPSDFPPVNLPFAEEARVDRMNPLYAEWVDVQQHPIVVRISDEGKAEAWFAQIVE